MSIHLPATVTRRRMCRVSGGVGVLAVLLATAFATPASAATAPVPHASHHKQHSSITQDGKPTLPDNSVDAAGNKGKHTKGKHANA
ncbi:MAG: hypothetical protein ABIZ05_03330 [Pseudonocardiaceae bacterium]